MKKKKVKDGEEKISRRTLIREYFKQNPLTKDLIKLSFYLILFFVIIIVVSFAPEPQEKSEERESTKTTENIKEEKKYKDILVDTLKEEKQYNYEINYNDLKYIINYSTKDNVISGILETSQNILKKFSIKDNQIYELTLNEEKLNMELFQELNLTYINIYSLVDLLSNHKSLKMLEDDQTIYIYNLETNKIINVTVREENITSIEIKEDTINYKITIE